MLNLIIIYSFSKIGNGQVVGNLFLEKVICNLLKSHKLKKILRPRIPYQIPTLPTPFVRPSQFYINWAIKLKLRVIGWKALWNVYLFLNTEKKIWEKEMWIDFFLNFLIMWLEQVLSFHELRNYRNEVESMLICCTNYFDKFLVIFDYSE